MVWARTASVGMLAIALMGCVDDGPRLAGPPSVATTAATTAATPAGTNPTATALAPSQVSASTVAPPSGVPACDVEELRFAAGDAVVLIRNAGAIRCEVDVSQSPNRDPLMEPSIWIDGGDEGELAVEPTDEGCAQPANLTSVDLVVNGQPVTAPVSLPATCSATLIAIYTAD
jgi:hypothetical protein